jgi:hypothetical protein
MRNVERLVIIDCGRGDLRSAQTAFAFVDGAVAGARAAPISSTNY